MSDLLQDLTASPALVRGDLLFLVIDPGGTPLDRKAAIEFLLANLPKLDDIVLQSEVDSVTFFQILDTDGGIAIFKVDTLNERIASGVSGTPLAILHLESPDPSAGGDQYLELTHTGISRWRFYATGTSDRDLTIGDGVGPIDHFTIRRDTGNINLAANLGIGATAPPSAGGTNIIFFGDNAADPTMASNTAGAYAKDVAGTVERFAIDEANNATQLTPHAKDAHDEMYLDTDLQYPRIRRTAFPLLERIVFYRDDTRTEISETYADYNARRSLIAGDNDFLKGKTHEEVEDEREAAYEAERAAAIAADEPDPGPYVREVEDPAYAMYRDRAEGLGTIKRVDSIVVSMGS